MAKPTKPTSVGGDAFRSAKWDELTAGRDFSQADAPASAPLVGWCQVVERCMGDVDVGGGVQVACQDDVGDIEAPPQLSTMMQASAEIPAVRIRHWRVKHGKYDATCQGAYEYCRGIVDFDNGLANIWASVKQAT
jgi:hypothetical protein